MPDSPDPSPAPRVPLMALAAFFAVFGACVLIAIAFTPDRQGRVVNLVSGLVLLAIAGGFYIGAARARRDAR